MTKASYLADPFTPQAEETRVHKITDFPIMIALPQAAGASDETMIAESLFRQHHKDGSALVESLRLMIMRAPHIADRVIQSANLGQESRRQAAISLRTFARTKIAQVPETL